MNNKEKVLKTLDDMISKLPKDRSKFVEIWMSNDLITHLDVKEYRGFKLYSNKMLPEDYAIIQEGSFFF